ncbi:gamma-glutamyltransferase [Anaeromyxobacter diazotrophicus]|uniref:Gamma-glutamyltransferase n=1 Tax=Anaeromyxobacter diazotrophicus TaxID=2590199 RepID=A0A7I9VIE9_9BACT|nr:gamma-glutamyltransferase [Anaeromyxobacter diazotrophicus]GEJ55787.1 gamma-glutamyltransferase [Anaeromyxobacter diazotrophicus]
MPGLASLLSIALSTLAVSGGGAVAASHPLASEAGAQVLRRGGNAVDAAVAAAFALSVVEPQSSGLGGGGFALVWLARERRAYALDFREVAPAAATADLFSRPGAPPRASLDGALAVAVPGAVKGYAELARRFGTKPLARLVEPAARLAERGFRAGHVYATRVEERLACLRADAGAAREFLVQPDEGGARVAPAPGARVWRRDLARTLRLLGKDPDAFYRGPLARRIADAVRARGGILSEQDLARYRVRERAPLEGAYRGHRILTMPLPSAGGALLLGLVGALEPEDPRAGGYRPERFLHVMIEAEKRLYARRGALLGDPEQVPGAAAAAAEMASPAFAAALHAAIGERATPAAEVTVDRERGETSHLSVVDGEGNAVALTTTVNYYFGSCLVVPGTGLLMNDEMDDFDSAPGTPNAYGLVGRGPNAIAPGKIPLSSMTPTLVLDGRGQVALAVGAAGGARIPTAVAQAILHVVDDGMRLDEALAAPRLHHQHTPDVVQVEPNGLEAATAHALAARGHQLSFAPSRWPNAQAAGRGPGGLFEAACDPRYEGAPAVP